MISTFGAILYLRADKWCDAFVNSCASYLMGIHHKSLNMRTLALRMWQLQGSTFVHETPAYFSNNFNNVYASLVTLFELTIVNNWDVIYSGKRIF